MHALPWEEASFDVVTSFRGVWGTTAAAVAEIDRVLVPGGRVGITVWGHIKASPGSWALAPFLLADTAKVENQAAMVALGRPGVGEELLARYGFVDIERVDVPFVWEFTDPETYARAISSTGPAYEAIQNVGEAAFTDAAVTEATATPPRWAAAAGRDRGRGLPRPQTQPQLIRRGTNDGSDWTAQPPRSH